MTATFTKVFASTLNSSVWEESIHTRMIWVTMMLMTDRDGVVESSIPGLARRSGSGITIEHVEDALAKFLAPDPYSRSENDDGRRIEKVDGGWRLINYQAYREARDAEARREYQAEWSRAKRRQTSTPKVDVDKCRQNRPQSTNAEEERDLRDRASPSRSALTLVDQGSHHAVQSDQGSDLREQVPGQIGGMSLAVIGELVGLPAVVAPKPSKPRSKHAGHPLPEDWTPNASHRARAVSRGLDVDHVADLMRAWSDAKATPPVYRNWDQAFSGWLLRQKPEAQTVVGRALAPGASRFGSSPTDTARRLFEEAKEREDREEQMQQLMGDEP